jgi:hypothetical protein
LDAYLHIGAKKTPLKKQIHKCILLRLYLAAAAAWRQRSGSIAVLAAAAWRQCTISSSNSAAGSVAAVWWRQRQWRYGLMIFYVLGIFSFCLHAHNRIFVTVL